MVNSLEKKLNELFKNLESKTVEVGFLEGNPTYEDGLNVATVAYINEHGNDLIPPRPFMSLSVHEQKENIGPQIAKDLKANGYDSSSALAVTGKNFQEEIQLNIVEWEYPENADYTVEKKGFNDPLIETGLMFDSVDFKVRKD